MIQLLILRSLHHSLHKFSLSHHFLYPNQTIYLFADISTLAQDTFCAVKTQDQRRRQTGRA